MLEGDGAALCFEPAAFGVEVFDLGSESGIELFTGVVASGFDFTDFALDRGKLGLAAAEVDVGCVDFLENFEDGSLVIGSGG